MLMSSIISCHSEPAVRCLIPRIRNRFAIGIIDRRLKKTTGDIRACTVCGSSIAGSARWSRTCGSIACSTAKRRSRPLTAHCVVCTKKFTTKRGKRANKCCSRECGFEYIRGGFKVERDRKDRALLGQVCYAEWKRCAACEKPFLAKREERDTCSVACAAKRYTISGCRCIDCGAKREHYSQRCGPCRERRKAGAKANYKPVRNKDKRKAEKARRRARGRTTIAAPVSLQDVLKVYGLKCHICGKRVNPSTTNQADSATMDHVVPMALGGWHDLCNLRPAHHLCNSRKGAEFTGQLMLTA